MALPRPTTRAELIARRFAASSLLRLAIAALAFAVAAPAAAQAFPKYGDEIYEPRLRQDGKDVMWLPTPDGMVTRMLEVAKVGKGDVVYDLGAGEGRIPIAAAQRYGATAVGIEYDAKLADLARRNAQRAGLADKVTIITGDIFKEDFTRATVVTLYLLPDLNQQLRPQLLALKPGTRIVSHMWDMGEWEPDEAFATDGSEAFMWIVPARVAGRWKLRDDRFFEGEVELVQFFQRIGGTVTVKGKTQPITGAYVNGPTIGFTFQDSDGAIRSVRAQVSGNRMSGQLRFPGSITSLTGQRGG